MQKSNRKSLPIGISDFKSLIERNKIYVDKTEYIYKLLENRYYFLSRPGRFGKSLLISTFYYLFKGEKELFKDLWIGKNTDFPFKKHPVIRFDFSSIENRTTEELEKSLKYEIKNNLIKNLNKEEDIENLTLKSAFKKLILENYEMYKENVVILIDEYDKPIIDNLFIANGEDRIKIAIQNRDRLRDFYGVLKDADVQAVTEFVFITGITKFSRMNIFSALNNLIDITMDERYSTMLGITEKEIDIYFDDYLEAFADYLNEHKKDFYLNKKDGKIRNKNTKNFDNLEKNNKIDKNFVKQKLKEYYNGYRFSVNPEKVYNPFSLLNCFSNFAFKNYWSQTGVPYYVANMLKSQNYYIPELEGTELSEMDLTSFELNYLDPVVVLFQAGFLTIIDVLDEFVYKIGFPNKEVATTFNSLMLKLYSESKSSETDIYAFKIARNFKKGNISSAIEIINTLLYNLPYKQYEKVSIYDNYIHSIFYSLIRVSGLHAYSEVLTSDGRIDCLIETDMFVYIIEFKCNQSTDVAIKQIKEKGYENRYSYDKRKVYLLGINFNTEKKEVEYVIEER